MKNRNTMTKEQFLAKHGEDHVIFEYIADGRAVFADKYEGIKCSVKLDNLTYVEGIEEIRNLAELTDFQFDFIKSIV